MISVVMPYWNRSFALSRALALYAKWYAEAKIEIVIVDDGSSDKPYVEPMPFPVRVVNLPRKDHPLCPVLPINEGVKQARGDILVITNPEILHGTPVLPQMFDELERLGENGYVLAAAFCRERNEWDCHTSRSNYATPMPPGFGYHFLGMLYRSLWDKAGGFDPDYRDGAAFDDNDFAWRLHKAGARCVIRDDLVVEHPKSGARIRWSTEALMRNRNLFFEKWRSALPA